MARCGRCGLWNPYPEDHKEQLYVGVCLWYQMRLREDSLYEQRDCPDFFERIPGMTPLEHFKYKIDRDDLGDVYKEAHRAKFVGYTALTLSILGLLLKLLGGE